MLAAPQIIRGHSTVRPQPVPEFTGWSSSSLRREGEPRQPLSLHSLSLWLPLVWNIWKDKVHWEVAKGREEQAHPPLHNPAPQGTFILHRTSMSCPWSPISHSLPSEYPIGLQSVNLKPLDKLLSSHVLSKQNFQSVMESMPANTHSDSLNPQKERFVRLFSLSKPQSRAGSVEWGYLGESGLQGTNEGWVWKWRLWRKALHSYWAESCDIQWGLTSDPFCRLPQSLSKNLLQNTVTGDVYWFYWDLSLRQVFTQGQYTF